MEFARTELAGGPMMLVYASMRDKAIEEITGLLFPLASQVFVTCTAQPRAASPEEIVARAGWGDQAQAMKAQVEPDPVRALAVARQATPSNGVVLAAGSLFLVGALKQALQERPIDSW